MIASRCPGAARPGDMHPHRRVVVLFGALVAIICGALMALGSLPESRSTVQRKAASTAGCNWDARNREWKDGLWLPESSPFLWPRGVECDFSDPAVLDGHLNRTVLCLCSMYDSKARYDDGETHAIVLRAEPPPIKTFSRRLTTEETNSRLRGLNSAIERVVSGHRSACPELRTANSNNAFIAAEPALRPAELETIKAVQVRLLMGEMGCLMKLNVIWPTNSGEDQAAGPPATHSIKPRIQHDSVNNSTHWLVPTEPVRVNARYTQTASGQRVPIVNAYTRTASGCPCFHLPRDRSGELSSAMSCACCFKPAVQCGRIRMSRCAPAGKMGFCYRTVGSP